ncbi:unnamed protein product [Cunninghamella blakesleeana]
MFGQRDIINKFFTDLPNVASPSVLQKVGFLEVKDAWDKINEEVCFQQTMSHDSMDEDEVEPHRMNTKAKENHLYPSDELNQLNLKQKSMYQAFIQEFESIFNNDQVNIQQLLEKIPMNHQRYVNTQLILDPTSILHHTSSSSLSTHPTHPNMNQQHQHRVIIIESMLQSLNFIQHLQGKLNYFSRLKKTIYYNNFYVYYNHLQHQYGMTCTQLLNETKHLFVEGDENQIKRRLIRYRKLGQRINGIITRFDKIIILFQDMMTRPRVEDLTDTTYELICQHIKKVKKPSYHLPATNSVSTPIKLSSSNNMNTSTSTPVSNPISIASLCSH